MASKKQVSILWAILAAALYALNAPLSKLLVTVVYIFTVVSFHKYDFTGLLPMVLFPPGTYQVA